ncbi:MAG: hypothetical protein MUC82_10390 [Cypionkella sp.]|nr:hypothetical protein [Cypionkella sp.]
MTSESGDACVNERLPFRAFCHIEKIAQQNVAFMIVVYSVYGSEKYFKDMQQSAASVRRWHPDARIICYTTPEGARTLADFAGEVRVIDDIRPKETSWHDPAFKVAAINRAFGEPFLFLDNDTYVAAPLTDAFGLLNSFDLLAVLAPITDQRIVKSYPTLEYATNVSAAFGEVNAGVLFISDGHKAEALLKRWQQLLLVNPHELGDQWRLRIALFEVLPRLGVLSNVYNYRLFARQPIFGLLHILHGPADSLPDVEKRLNTRTSYRHVAIKNGLLDLAD